METIDQETTNKVFKKLKSKVENQVYLSPYLDMF